jgi:acyl-CoA synthetase (NDP forming)
LGSAIDLIDEAIREGRTALSEYDSKRLLASHGIPVTREILVAGAQEVARAAAEIGYPVVLKGCSSEIAHKTEKGLVRLDVRSDGEARSAFQDIVASMSGIRRPVVLVQEMIRSPREFLAGLIRDRQFGPCVTFGLGGIFTEVLRDLAFRVAPFGEKDALEMMREIRGRKILESVRGLEPVDLDGLASILVTLGRIGIELPQIVEIDINPILVARGTPIAADALVVLSSE